MQRHHKLTNRERVLIGLAAMLGSCVFTEACEIGTHRATPWQVVSPEVAVMQEYKDEDKDKLKVKL